jgi:hypothetical protein
LSHDVLVDLDPAADGLCTHRVRRLLAQIFEKDEEAVPPIKRPGKALRPSCVSSTYRHALMIDHALILPGSDCVRVAGPVA